MLQTNMPYKTTSSRQQLKRELDPILHNGTCLDNENLAPGIVFGVTNDKETVYLNHSGYLNIETKDPVTNDSKFAMLSATKPISSLAMLQLVDRNLVDLDTPVEKYLPKFASVTILTKDANGNKVFSKPKNKATLRQLLTHTAGFAYSFTNEDYLQTLVSTGQPNLFDSNSSTFDATYLTFEPGTDWSYGMGLDWAGLVLEEVTGLSLGEYIRVNILEPAKMNNTTFKLSKTEKDLMLIHVRGETGMNVFDLQYPRESQIDMAGHGLFGTVDDYLKFIRIWLNKGKTDDGVQLLSEKLWEVAVQSNLPKGTEMKNLDAYQANLCGPVSFPPDSSWTLGFCRNGTDFHTGRKSGSLWWCGVANCYLWVDLKTKIGGFYATQVFPYGDPSRETYYGLEEAVYNNLN
ncbi:beta-lactamase/transpeptidase-like protein [Scheffersomyces xylosifermentans]|uniref:beta-lactamase/transpeptidase-like protein n=1 Tax=Scheffersomyces xylosifermentans TaxID=1304137 RepID=UPI00315DC686